MRLDPDGYPSPAGEWFCERCAPQGGMNRFKVRPPAADQAPTPLEAAIAEALLLLMLSRASQRRLEAHLVAASSASHGDEALPEEDRQKLLSAAREHPILRLALAVALTFLAFALVTAMSTFR